MGDPLTDIELRKLGDRMQTLVDLLDFGDVFYLARAELNRRLGQVEGYIEARKNH